MILLSIKHELFNVFISNILQSDLKGYGSWYDAGPRYSLCNRKILLGLPQCPTEDPSKPILGHPVEVILCTEVVTVAG